MAKKHLSLEPKQINSNAWYYEEAYGIHIYYDHEDDYGEVHINFKIPWRMLRASLKRKDK